MNTLMIDSSAYRAASARVDGDVLIVGLMNGREFTVPLMFFSELEGLSESLKADVEVIIDGSGIMFGDSEAITMARILGIDERPPYNERVSFSLV